MAGVTVKAAAEALNTTEHYVRQLIKTFNLETRAGEPAPRGLKATTGTNEAGQAAVFVDEESLAAYKAKRESGSRGGGGGGHTSVDGRKVFKIRLNPAEIEAIQAQFPEAGASIKSGSNYNPAKSKAYRHKKAAEKAAPAEVANA